MCWQAVVKATVVNSIDAAKESIPAAGAVGVFTVGGVSIGVPPLLVGLGQAVIVVYFTLRGVERKNKERDAEIKELAGAVNVLAGRFAASCANPENHRRRIGDPHDRRAGDFVQCPSDPMWQE